MEMGSEVEGAASPSLYAHRGNSCVGFSVSVQLKHACTLHAKCLLRRYATEDMLNKRCFNEQLLYLLSMSNLSNVLPFFCHVICEFLLLASQNRCRYKINKSHKKFKGHR